jgi:hypothetical protein
MAQATVSEAQEGRKVRGAELAAAGAVSANSRHDWRVQSGAQEYSVRLEGARPVSCACQDWKRRGAVVGPCKHIRGVQIMLKVWQHIEETDDLAALYTRAVIRLTLVDGWEAHALVALIATIEGLATAAPRLDGPEPSPEPPAPPAPPFALARAA